MGIQNFGPDHDLGLRLTKIEEDIKALSTRDVLQNASIGVGGLTVSGSGGINVTGGGSITITGTGILNVAAGGLSSAGAITAATSISAGTTLSAGGAISGASLNVGGGLVTAGNISASGSIAVAADINLTGDLYSPHGKATPVVSAYVVAYFNGPDGRLGASPPSAVINKQDVTPPNAGDLVQALLRISLVRFKYIANVAALGDAAPDELGGIAEYFDTTALGEYVYRDDNEKPIGINYERLSIPLIAVVQSLDMRLKTIEAKLIAAGL